MGLSFNYMIFYELFIKIQTIFIYPVYSVIYAVLFILDMKYGFVEFLRFIIIQYGLLIMNFLYSGLKHIQLPVSPRITARFSNLTPTLSMSNLIF